MPSGGSTGAEHTIPLIADEHQLPNPPAGVTPETPKSQRGRACSLGRIGRLLFSTRLLPYWVLAGFALISLRVFFSQGSILISDFVPPSAWVIFQNEPYAFDAGLGGGAFNLNLASFPIDSTIYGLTAVLGSEAAYRVVIVGVTIASGAALVVLVREFVGRSEFSPIPELIGGLVYCSNPWYISVVILGGHATSIGVAYSATPILLWAVWRVLRRDRWTDWAVLTFCCALILDAYDYELILLLPALACFLFARIAIPEVHAVKLSSRKVIRLAMAFGAAIALNAFWIVPTLQAFALGIVPTTGAVNASVVASDSANASVLNNLRLLGYNSQAYSFGLFQTSSSTFNDLYFLSSFAVFALGFLPIALPRLVRWPSSRLWAYSSISFMVYLLLAGGSTILGSLYVAAAQLLPFLGTPSLFLGWICLVYAFTIPISLTWILRQRDLLGLVRLRARATATPGPRLGPSEARQRRAVSWARALAALAVALLLISVWPAFTGDYRGAYPVEDVPQAYEAAYSWLQSHSNGTASLWFPPLGTYVQFTWSGRFGYSTVADPVRWQIESPTVNPTDFSVDSQVQTTYVEQVQQLLYSDATQDIGGLLAQADIGYLVIRTDVVPVSWGYQLLNNSLNQSDLAEVWSSGPVHIFKNLEQVSLARVSESPVVAFGGYSAITTLSWYGLAGSGQTPVLPESVSYSDRQSLLESPNTTILLESQEYVGLLASMISPSYWLNVTSALPSDWFSDDYSSANYGDAMYSPAASTDTSTPLVLALTPRSAGSYVILVRATGGSTDFETSLMGVPLEPSLAPGPQQGYAWVEYFANLSQGKSQLSIAPTSVGFNSVGSVVVLPLQLFELTMARLVALFESSRLVDSYAAFTLFPGASVNWTNFFSNGTRSPVSLGLVFSNSTGYAYSNSPFWGGAGNYRIGVLVRSDSDVEPGEVGVELSSDQSGTGSLIVQGPVTGDSSLSWMWFNLSVPTGEYSVTVLGRNVEYASLEMAPEESVVAGNTDGGGAVQLVSSAVRASTLAGTFTVSVNSTGPVLVSLAFGFSGLWRVTSSDGTSELIVAGGYSVAALINGSSGRDSTVTFEFVPQSVELSGIVISVSAVGFTVAMPVAAALVIFISRRSQSRAR